MAKKSSDTVENIMETKENNIKTGEISFSKQAFLSSKSYKPHRDLIEALLESGKSYTKNEVNKMIDDYLKRSVK